VSHVFTQRLSDDALAFVLAHEMAHHDLGHLSAMYLAAGVLGNWQKMEFAADRQGLALAVRAGYSAAGALEAFDPRWEGEEDADPFADWPPALAVYLNRFRRSHPPMADRRAALASG
jgi:Zn-dependent protease with chaperone function